MTVSRFEREHAIGAAVVAGAVLVLALAYGGTVSPNTAGYELKARFAKAEGISPGAEVRLSGVNVGEVVAQTLDDKFRALVTLRVHPGVMLPKDSAALVETDGLLGGKFISIQPGSDDQNLKPGGEFQFTQSSMNLGDILELIISQAEDRRGEAPQPGK